MSEQEKRPNVIAIALAGLAPIAMSVVATVMFGVAVGRGGSRAAWATFMDAGFAAWFVVAAWLVGGLVVAGLLAAAAHGMRVPSALTIGFGALPWLLGAVGTWWSVRFVEGVLQAESIDPSQRARIMAVGIAEASGNRLLGCVLSAALLAAVALGFGIGALGRRADARRGLGAIVGALAALPLLGCAAYASIGGFSAVPLVLLVLPALIAGVGLMLAGAGAGSDEPSARAAALCSAAPMAGGLAIVAGAAAMTTGGVRQILNALSIVDPVQRASLAASGAAELSPAFWVERWGSAVMLLGVIALGAWALRSARPTPGRIAGAVGVGLVLVSVIGMDALVRAQALRGLASVSRPPWHAVTGFSPVQLDAALLSGDVYAIVTPEAIHLPSADPIALGALDEPERRRAVVDRVRSALALGNQNEPPAKPETPEPSAVAPQASASEGSTDKPRNRYGIRPPPDASDPQAARKQALADAAEFGMLGLLNPSQAPGTPIATPSLTLALDARVDARAIKKLLALAKDAGARSVTLVGTSPMSTEQAARLAEARKFPLLAPIAEPPECAQRVLLESSLPAGAADRDATLWHVTIRGENDPLRLERRKGSGDAVTIEPTPPGEDSRAPPPGPRGVVYLLLGAPVTAQVLGSVAARLEARGLTPIALAGDAVPGRPSEPLAVMGFGTGLGGFGGSGTASRAPRVRMGAVSVSGRLPPEVIQRIVRQSFGRFRLCYENGLKDDPKLAGRVAVRFTIGRDGSVSNVADAGSDIKSPSVVSCVTRAFHGLSFPQPEGGIVSVTYPILFSLPEPNP